MFSESIVIGLTAQGFSPYSPFWSPVIGRKPVNSIREYLFLSIGYISSQCQFKLSSGWRTGMRRCSSSMEAGSKGKRI